MKKHLSRVFSAKGIVFSFASVFLLGFSIPCCKKATDVPVRADEQIVVTSPNLTDTDIDADLPASTDQDQSSASADSSPVVIQFTNGQVVTKDAIEKVASDIIAQSPYGSMKPSDLPEAIYTGLITQVIDGEIVACWAKDNKIFSRADFKADMAKIISMIEKAKAAEFFAKEIKAGIKKASDSKIEAYYNQNLKNYIKSSGGTTTAMVTFDSKEEAQDLLASLNVGGDAATIDAMKGFQAQSKIGEYKSLGKVTKDMLEDGEQKASPYGFPKTNAPKAVLKFVKHAKKYPHSGLVELDGGKVAVVLCADHTESTYYSLAEVKSHIAQMLEQEVLQEEYKSKMADLSKKYVAKLNKQVLDRPKQKGMKSGEIDKDLMNQLMNAANGQGLSEEDLSDEALQSSLAELQGMDEQTLGALAESLGK